MQLYTIVLPLLAGFISVASALPIEARDNGLVARENIDARDTLATRAGRPSYLDKDGFVIDVTVCTCAISYLYPRTDNQLIIYNRNV
jgi:hypothetical protein